MGHIMREEKGNVEEFKSGKFQGSGYFVNNIRPYNTCYRYRMGRQRLDSTGLNYNVFVFCSYYGGLIDLFSNLYRIYVLSGGDRHK